MLKCVTSEDVGSGVAECDPQSIWNPRKNCESFVYATPEKKHFENADRTTEPQTDTPTDFKGG